MARHRGLVATLARMQREAQRAEAARARAVARSVRNDQRAQAAAARARVADERQRQRMHAAARTAEAAEDTAELERTVAALNGVLAATLNVDDFLDLETLKQPPQLPYFDPAVAGPLGPPPRLEDYLPPPLSGTGRLFGGATRHAEQTRQAHAAYAQRAAAYQAEVQQHAARLDAARRQYDAEVARLTAEHQQWVADVESLQRGLAAGHPDAVVRYLDLVLERASYPDGFPHSWRLAYTPGTRQLAVEYELPHVDVVPTVKTYRYVKSTDSVTETARPQAQIRSLYTSVIAQTALRVVHELLEADRAGQ